MGSGAGAAAVFKSAANAVISANKEAAPEDGEQGRRNSVFEAISTGTIKLRKSSASPRQSASGRSALLMSLGSLGRGRDSLRKAGGSSERRGSNGPPPRLSMADQISLAMDNRRSAFKRSSVTENSTDGEDSDESEDEWE